METVPYRPSWRRDEAEPISRADSTIFCLPAADPGPSQPHLCQASAVLQTLLPLAGGLQPSPSQGQLVAITATKVHHSELTHADGSVASTRFPPTTFRPRAITMLSGERLLLCPASSTADLIAVLLAEQKSCFAPRAEQLEGLSPSPGAGPLCRAPQPPHRAKRTEPIGTWIPRHSLCARRRRQIQAPPASGPSPRPPGAGDRPDPVLPFGAVCCVTCAKNSDWDTGGSAGECRQPECAKGRGDSEDLSGAA